MYVCAFGVKSIFVFGWPSCQQQQIDARNRQIVERIWTQNKPAAELHVNETALGAGDWKRPDYVSVRERVWECLRPVAHKKSTPQSSLLATPVHLLLSARPSTVRLVGGVAMDCREQKSLRVEKLVQNLRWKQTKEVWSDGCGSVQRSEFESVDPMCCCCWWSNGVEMFS